MQISARPTCSTGDLNKANYRAEIRVQTGLIGAEDK